jgi:hypothetical protein
MKTSFLVAVLAIAATGCASAYTSIRKIDDSTYMLTRTKAGFGKTYGTLYICKPIGQSPDLQCTELAEP